MVSLSKYAFKIINRKLFILVNFIVPNFKAIIHKRIVCVSKYPNCIQKIFVTGKGKIYIGEKCTLGYKLGGFFRHGCIEFQPRYFNSIIKIGRHVTVNNNLFICSANLIEIGDYTLVGQYVTILDHEAHSNDPKMRKQIGEIGTVKICENVWIGNNVTILKNSVIGKNSIVATGSVVTGEFPENVILGGVPAKVIKNI